MENALEIYQKARKKLNAFHYAMYLISWDSETEAPVGCLEERSKQIGELVSMMLEISHCKEYVEAVKTLYDKKEELTTDLKLEIVKVWEELEKELKIPEAELIEYEMLLAKANNIWCEAKLNNNYALFAPVLAQIINWQKKYIQYLETDTLKGYDVLLNDYEKGLQLYSRGVFIMDKASDLIPEHFRFVKGLVDSQDLSLNISREMLQHDRQLKVIADRIEKKIQSELTNMLKKDRETYEKFFKNFGLQLKFGIYQSYGMLKDKLQDLLLFYSGKEEKMITLKEYVENMKEGQTEIYFASGETKEKISHLPQVEAVRDRDFDVLYMMDNVDEFMIQMMRDYDSKAFKNVAQGDLNLDSEEEKKELEKINEDNKSLLESLKEALKDKVVDVKVSNRLKSHPVCLVSDQGVSFEMEKVLNAMPDGQDVKAGRILEINPNHDIFKAIQNVYQNNADKINDYASLLFDQALLIEGLSIEDPVAFSNKICELMIELNK